LLFSAFDEERKITEAEAIKLAEEFIKDNGYTAFTANTLKLQVELFDALISGGNTDSILRRRHNTLYPKAYCILEQRRPPHIGSFTGYVVGLLSTSVQVGKLSSRPCKSNLTGKAIRISMDGGSVEMEHKMPLFSYFGKLRKCLESLVD